MDRGLIVPLGSSLWACIENGSQLHLLTTKPFRFPKVLTNKFKIIYYIKFSEHKCCTYKSAARDLSLSTIKLATKFQSPSRALWHIQVIKSNALVRKFASKDPICVHGIELMIHYVWEPMCNRSYTLTLKMCTQQKTAMRVGNMHAVAVWSGINRQPNNKFWQADSTRCRLVLKWLKNLSWDMEMLAFLPVWILILGFGKWTKLTLFD